MAGYELPQIGDGRKAAQCWIYTTGIPQDDIFTDSIWVQEGKYINCGLRVGMDAQSILTGLGFDWASTGKWFDLEATVVLQRLMPEENDDFYWRTVKSWSVTIGNDFEEIVEHASESCIHRLGVLGDDYSFGEGVLRIGTS